MLDMDLDLEADLGVDTVKQAEVFAAVREAYGIERQESLKLRDFPTLQHVVAVRATTSGRTSPPGARCARRDLPSRRHSAGCPGRMRRPPLAGSRRSTEAPRDRVVEKVLAIVAEKTGYPPDMLEMDLDLEADLGVDTVKQAETFAAVREAYGIAATGEPEAPRLPDARRTSSSSCTTSGPI